MDKIILILNESPKWSIPQNVIGALVEYGWYGFCEADIEILKRGPTYRYSNKKREGYWEAWGRVVHNARWEDPDTGEIYALLYNKDLWAYSLDAAKNGELNEYLFLWMNGAIDNPDII